MPSYPCCVGGCDNDTRYPERIIKRGHVQELKFHHFPKDPEKRTVWVLKYPTIKLCVPTILRMENQHLETLYQLYIWLQVIKGYHQKREKCPVIELMT